MCELFAMSARYPTTVSMSLEEFSRHGGLTGPHKDGWGLGWYEDRDLRLVKERYPSAESACARFIQNYPFSSEYVISHIRRATLGEVASRNCQPFARELGGVWHCFAHNGDLRAIDSDGRFRASGFRPVGETDSEQAFCALMDALRPLWSSREKPPLRERSKVVSEFASALRELGPANFMYCDGDALFAHADRRHQTDGSIRAPGMWRLTRHCPAGGELAVEGLRIATDEREQEVVLIASVPLSGEDWEPLAAGTVLVARAGRLADTLA